MKITVHILVIDDKHGTEVQAFGTEAECSAANADYCADHWTWDDDPPEDSAAMSEVFWDRMSNYGEAWHRTEQCQIDVEVANAV